MVAVVVLRRYVNLMYIVTSTFGHLERLYFYFVQGGIMYHLFLGAMHEAYTRGPPVSSTCQVREEYGI